MVQIDFYENFDEYDRSFGDVMRLHVRDRYLKVYQKFKVGNVPILTQIVKIALTIHYKQIQIL